MLIAIALIAVIVTVPVGIDVLSVGQASTSTTGALAIEAKQAAMSGISDYVNHAEAAPLTSLYTQYCSEGVSSFNCPSDSGPDATNPAFANTDSLTGNTWATIPSATGGTESYHYVVDAPSSSKLPTPVTIYSTGRAGASGHYVYSVEEAALTVCANGCGYSTTGFGCVTVPPSAGYAQIVATGAQGGAGGASGANGGAGASVTAWVPVTAGDTLDLSPGAGGMAGSAELLNIFGTGGPGGITGPNICQPTVPAPINLTGGSGSQAIINLLSTSGGGGGAATAIYDATHPAMLVVAGGGGGGGGNAATVLLGDPPGAGEDGAGAGTSTINSGFGDSGGAGGSTPGVCILVCLVSPTSGGTGGSAPTTVGTSGSPMGLIAAGAGGGGGGGGGYIADSDNDGTNPPDGDNDSDPGTGGGAPGGSSGLLGLLGLGPGSGGGSGASYVAPSSCPVPTFTAGPSSTSPNGSGGSATITFYVGGGTCGQTVPATIVKGVGVSVAMARLP